jgi:hypothetical protein
LPDTLDRGLLGVSMPNGVVRPVTLARLLGRVNWFVEVVDACCEARLLGLLGCSDVDIALNPKLSRLAERGGSAEAAV